MSAVREAVERRRGYACVVAAGAGKPALGLWRALRAVGEAVPVPVSCRAGHSRLLAEGTKEEEKSEEASLSSAFGEGGREAGEGTMAGQIAGVLQSSQPLATVACLQEAPGRAPSTESLGKAEGKAGGEVSVLSPRLLRSFPAAFLIDSCLRRTLASLCRADTTYSQVSSFPEKILV